MKRVVVHVEALIEVPDGGTDLKLMDKVRECGLKPGEIREISLPGVIVRAKGGE